MSALLRRLMYLLRRSRHDADLRDEIEAHRAHRRDALERGGLAPGDAARASQRAMGNVTLAVEDVRDVWVSGAVDQLWQDIRIGARGLRKNPGFALVAIATLTLGIGANTALFSIFNGLILRPLPVRDPGRLALLLDGSWSYPLWTEIKARENDLFDGAIAWANERFDLSRGGQSAFVDGAYVSGRFFEVLGVSAERGRMLTPADDVAAAPDGPVAVISHRFWREQFAGADDVIGRQITLQRRAFTVVGVMPPGFFGVDVGRMTEVMLPFAAERLVRGQESRLVSVGWSWLDIIVRRKPGQSLAQANAGLRGVQPQIRAATVGGVAATRAARYLTRPLTLEDAATGRSSLRAEFEKPLMAMIGAVGLLLLVACTNIASLVVARALARRRELAVRLALGGSRGRLARLAFTESLIVATAGAALGLVFARWSGALLVRQLSTWEGDVSLALALDWRVLGFSVSLACASAIVAGVAPALGLRSVAAGEALKDAGRGLAGDRRFAVRGTLVAAQVAMSLMLVTAAGLFLRSFASLNQLPLGFVPEPLLIAELDLQASAAPIEQRGPQAERLRAAAAAVPGVRSASLSRVPLLTGGGWGANRVAIDDEPMPVEDLSANRLWLNATSPGWFGTMGTPLVNGRDFTDGDRVGAPLVAIVNQALVRRYQLGAQPIGRTVRIGLSNGERRYEIVGVVGDSAYTEPRDGMMATLYVPFAQVQPLGETVIMTINADRGRRAAVERDVAAALARTEPAIGFIFRTFEQFIDARITQERLTAMVSSFFGGLALLLAGIGLYGIVAQAVRTSQGEIGLRLALGAQPAGILRLVLRRVGVLIVVGLALGLAGSLWAAQFVGPLLFQVEARDPATFAGAAGALVAAGVLAAWLPARRAARLDPATVLREG
ncbi:MAG TPA: ABC transporter permease [Vicinamibacterales bacterium]|nr:ABC transporter permease [Vicinamibacterales bacterium]